MELNRLTLKTYPQPSSDLSVRRLGGDGAELGGQFHELRQRASPPQAIILRQSPPQQVLQERQCVSGDLLHHTMRVRFR